MKKNNQTFFVFRLQKEYLGDIVCTKSKRRFPMPTPARGHIQQIKNRDKEHQRMKVVVCILLFFALLLCVFFLWKRKEKNTTEHLPSELNGQTRKDFQLCHFNNSNNRLDNPKYRGPFQ